MSGYISYDSSICPKHRRLASHPSGVTDVNAEVVSLIYEQSEEVRCHGEGSLNVFDIAFTAPFTVPDVQLDGFIHLFIYVYSAHFKMPRIAVADNT